MCTSWMLTVPVYLIGGLVCKINGGEGEHLNRSISERGVRKLHVAYWTQEKGAKKEKALWMHYSAMLGHSNQRLLSACIYCVNNDRTLTFSTDAVCLSVPLHPVSSCKCSVYTVSREDTVWLEMFRWGISPPLNLIRFQALFLCYWSDHFLLHLISLEVTFALSFLLCLCLNWPFHMCPLQILQWLFLLIALRGWTDVWISAM